jgi:hypothetical protein
VEQANIKLRQNWNKLQQLHDTVASSLFQTIPRQQLAPPPTSQSGASTQISQSMLAASTNSLSSRIAPSSASSLSCLLQCHNLPDLNLWGHAAIVIPVDDTSTGDDELERPPRAEPNDDMDDKDGGAVNLEEDGASETTVATSNHQYHHIAQDVDVMVIGGYGKGPNVVMVPTRLTLSRRNSSGWTTMVSSKTKCQRSDQVYCLQRRNGVWNDHWMRQAPGAIISKSTSHPTGLCKSSSSGELVAVLDLHHPHDKDINSVTLMLHGRIPVRRVAFTARESVDGCLLPLAAAFRTLASGDSDCHAPDQSNKPVVAIWGGRTSPCQPLDELLLYEHTVSASSSSTTKLQSDEGEESNSRITLMRTVNWVTPIQVQGHGPSPRWGHTMTALSGRFQGRMAVVVGGRNEDQACLDTVHVLCLGLDSSPTAEASPTAYFRWEAIDLTTPKPRFFHSTAVLGLSSERADDETILVFGGKTDPKDLFESFSDSLSDLRAIVSPDGDLKQANQRKHLYHQSENDDSDLGCLCRQKQRAPPCLMSIQLGSGEVQTCEQLLPYHYEHHPQSKLIMEGSHMNGSSRVCIPELGCAASTVQVRNPESGDKEELVMVVGGTAATDTDPFLCFRVASSQMPASSVETRGVGITQENAGRDNLTGLLMQPCPVVLDQSDADAGNAEMSVLVHHRCVVLPSSPSHGEILLLGGGVSSFAFGPCFAR